MVYDDETLQVERDQQKLKNKNVYMQGFEERLKGLVFQCDSGQYLRRVKKAISYHISAFSLATKCNPKGVCTLQGQLF